MIIKYMLAFAIMIGSFPPILWQKFSEMLENCLKMLYQNFSVSTTVIEGNFFVQV